MCIHPIQYISSIVLQLLRLRYIDAFRGGMFSLLFYDYARLLITNEYLCIVMTPTNYIKTEGNKIEVCLDVIFKKEGDAIVSYAPALELSGCGKDEEEARKSFEIVLNAYIKYTIENGTLEADLVRHNWKKEVIKQQEVFAGQEFPLILLSNELARSMTRGRFSKSSERMTISC